MKKYYPNPTFLAKAVRIRQKRSTKALIALVITALLVLLISFVLWGAGKQAEYSILYPNLVGAATTDPTTVSIPGRTERTIAETTPEETAETETTQSQLQAFPEVTSSSTAESSEETAETTQNNLPDTWTEPETAYFNNSYPLQAITHEERDMRLDDLMQAVKDYANGNPNERISFRYVNLRNNESTGINELSPIVPAGAFTLPFGIVLCERMDIGLSYSMAVIRYDGSSGTPSFIADNYQAGKQFYLRTLMNYAVAKNDVVALNYILNNIGGEEKAWETIRTISGYMDYTAYISYADYLGVQQSGPHRSSVYDLAEYAGYLYYGFINSPDTYAPLINDMYYSEVPTPYSDAFPNSRIYHMSGRNDPLNAYTDVAIIDGEEPIVLAISCECNSYERACEIMTTLSSYVQQYISSCH